MASFEDEISCKGLVEVVTDYLEGGMSPREVQIIDKHLATCDGCRHYLDQMRTTIVVIGRLRSEDVPPQMRERLLAAFREMKKS